MLGSCAVHAGVEAVVTCERCGAFACAECMHLTDTVPSQTLCTACFQRFFGEKASGRAVLALVLGIIGISGCFILGLPTLWLASVELAAIERGEAPAKGRNLALGARWLAIAQFVILGLIGLLVVGLLGLRRW